MWNNYDKIIDNILLKKKNEYIKTHNGDNGSVAQLNAVEDAGKEEGKINEQLKQNNMRYIFPGTINMKNDNIKNDRD